MQSRRKQGGFSLIELLIVVTIIGIVASIAVPNLLASKRAANEASAIGNIRVIHSANVAFQVTNGGGEYAPDFTALATAGLIDAQVGSGTKSGYNFAISRTLSGPSTLPTFAVTANPRITTGNGLTGTRRFGLTQSGVIYYSGSAAQLAVPLTPAEMVGIGAGTIKVLGN